VQLEAFSQLNERTRRYRTTAIPPLRDADVAEAASSLAATFETESRGIFFDHSPSSLPAQRLAQEYRQVLADLAPRSTTPGASRMAAVFRRIEEGARRGSASLPDGETAYLDLLDRLGTAETEAGKRVWGDEPDRTPPRIIVP
jgi:hypothetical protein